MKKFLSIVLLTASAVSCFGGVVMANNCKDSLFFEKARCGTDQVNIRIGYYDDVGRTTIFRDKTDSTPVYVRNDTKNPVDNPEGTKMDVKVLSEELWYIKWYTLGDPYARCLPGGNLIRSNLWESGKSLCRLRITSGEKGKVLTPHGVWSPDSVGTYHIANCYS